MNAPMNAPMNENEHRIELARPWIGPEEQAAVAEVLASGRLADGPWTRRFEEAFAAVEDTVHGIAVHTGTAALVLTLQAAGIGAGDEVVLPSLTFVASATAVLAVGARPVFADVDPVTCCLDPDAVAAKLSPRTRAVLAVHLHGLPAHLAALHALCAERGVLLLQDAAQAIGARYDGLSVGTFGTACFSLYATKNITTGEGGMVVTDDAALADRLRALRSHGMVGALRGTNARLPEVAAAIGVHQLARLDGWQKRREQIAETFTAAFADHPSLRPLGTDARATSAWHNYTVRVPSRRPELAAHLDAAGIASRTYYPRLAHELVGLDAYVPASRLASEQTLSLPMHPLLDDDEIASIVAAVNAWR